MKKKEEQLIQQAIITYLSMIENMGRCYFIRNNSFSGYVQRANGSRGYIKNSKKGSPDIIVGYQRRFIGLEVKSLKGRQSDAQKRSQERIERCGCEYYIVRSVDEVSKIIK